jgi:hypothetical protein
MCCALGICCPPASAAQRDAIASLIIKDGKWTDPDLARAIATATMKRYFGRKFSAASHKKFRASIDTIIAAHSPENP